MKQLAQIPEKLTLKIPHNNKLNQKTIENSLTKLKNLISLDLSKKYCEFGDLDQLECLKIYRPSTEYINSLTRITQLKIIVDDILEDTSFNLSTTIEALIFSSTSKAYLDPDSTFQLNEHYSSLTRLSLNVTDIIGQFSSLTKLKNLTDLCLKRSRALRESWIADTHTLPRLNRIKLMEDISSMTTLTRLVVEFNIDEADSEKLAQLTGLKSIEICDYKVNMTYWRYLTNLENIQLFSYHETGRTLQHLPAEKLTKLSFFISHIGYNAENVIAHINRMSHLRTLHLEVEDNKFKFQSNIALPNLENLSLKVKCRNMDLRHLQNMKTFTFISENLPLHRLDLPPNLGRIHLRSNTTWKKPVRAEIFPNLASMTKLKEFYMFLTNGSINLVHENISRMTQLERLYIEVANSTLDEELLQSLTNLTTLQLDIQLKNNSGNGSFLSSMTKLRHLKLMKYGCNNECIRGLSKFGNLTYLFILKPSEDIHIDSALRLTNLQRLIVPIYHGDYSTSQAVKEALQANLPFLDNY